MLKVVLSSGHGSHISGAVGPSPWGLHEHTEAVRVVNQTAIELRSLGVDVVTYEDTVSHTQDENLDRICSFHNAQGAHDLDVSVHFNSTDPQPTGPVGCEVFYQSNAGMEVADEVVDAICTSSGLKNRGPKDGNLYFLSHTEQVAILVEVCFVNSHADVDIYHAKFADICAALAVAIAGGDVAPGPIPPEPSPEPPGERPTIGPGDVGPHVQNAQESLGIVPADGDFGPTTEGGVKGYQAACGLSVDGVVGPKTWAALDDLDQAKAEGNDGLSQAQIDAIIEIAENSAIARYSWHDRGVAPKGYTAGVALCFGLAAMWLAEGDDDAMAMAQADRDDSDDALTWYRSKFNNLGMDNSEDGIDTLRHLFVMILGLGMRESSGCYCEGRDMSAENTSADEAEAGLFQTSWNIRSCSSEIPPLLTMYWENPNGFLSAFQHGVSPDSNDLGNYGSGDGARYQFLSKFAPAFHAMVTAIGMRYLGGEDGHWGPIRRNEVELRKEANTMLLDVQDYLSRVA